MRRFLLAPLTGETSVGKVYAIPVSGGCEGAPYIPGAPWNASIPVMAGQPWKPGIPGGIPQLEAAGPAIVPVLVLLLMKMGNPPSCFHALGFLSVRFQPPLPPPICPDEPELPDDDSFVFRGGVSRVAVPLLMALSHI